MSVYFYLYLQTLFMCTYVYICVHISVDMHLYTHRYMYIFFLLIYLFIYLLIYSFIYLFIYLFIYIIHHNPQTGRSLNKKCTCTSPTTSRINVPGCSNFPAVWRKSRSTLKLELRAARKAQIWPQANTFGGNMRWDQWGLMDLMESNGISWGFMGLTTSNCMRFMLD